MEWLWGAALLPLALCGAMCVGGIVLAAVGLRRGTGQQDRGCHSRGADRADADRVPEHETV